MSSLYKDTNDTSWTNEFPILIVDGVTLIASLLFLMSFIKTSARYRSPGHSMMVILSLNDMLIPLAHIIGLFFKDDQELYDNILFPTLITCLHFSIYWTFVIAFFMYLLLTSKRSIDSRRYTVKSSIICLLLAPYSSILPILFPSQFQVFEIDKALDTVIFPNQHIWARALAWIIYDGFGTLLAICAIFYCYNRIINLLRTRYRYTPFVTQNSMTAMRVNIYSSLPFLCFFPFVLIHFYNIFVDEEDMKDYLRRSITLVKTLGVIRRCWGFLNLLAYWLFKPSSERSEERSESQVSMVKSDSGSRYEIESF